MSPMNVAKKLMLNVLRSGGAPSDPFASFTVTTTGAETLTLNAFTVSAATTVDWGDGSSNEYTGAGARTHDYAGAGTWTVQILEPLNVTTLDLRDTKITALAGDQVAKCVNLTTLTLVVLSGLSWTVGAAAPMPTGLTTLNLSVLTGLSWTVGASAPMPTGLTTLNLNTLGVSWTVGASAPMPTGLTSLTLSSLSSLSWTVGASAPMPTGLTSLTLTSLSSLSWTVGASAPMPTGLTTLYFNNVLGLSIVSTLSACLALTSVRIENFLSDAAQSVILSELYAAFPTRTGTNGTIDLLGGGNAVSGGTSGAACPPTTTREYGYELVNDSCGISAKHWASVSLQT